MNLNTNINMGFISTPIPINVISYTPEIYTIANYLSDKKTKSEARIRPCPTLNKENVLLEYLSLNKYEYIDLVVDNWFKLEFKYIFLCNYGSRITQNMIYHNKKQSLLYLLPYINNPEQLKTIANSMAGNFIIINILHQYNKHEIIDMINLLIYDIDVIDTILYSSHGYKIYQNLVLMDSYINEIKELFKKVDITTLMTKSRIYHIATVMLINHRDILLPALDQIYQNEITGSEGVKFLKGEWANFLTDIIKHADDEHVYNMFIWITNLSNERMHGWFEHSVQYKKVLQTLLYRYRNNRIALTLILCFIWTKAYILDNYLKLRISTHKGIIKYIISRFEYIHITYLSNDIVAINSMMYFIGVYYQNFHSLPYLNQPSDTNNVDETYFHMI
jgi:hypothetical protein